MLVAALNNHRAALRASFQAEYRLRLLDDGRTDPPRDLDEVVDLAAHLPPGCALYRDTGGERSLTLESALLREVVYRQDLLGWSFAGSKGKEPERLPMSNPHQQNTQSVSPGQQKKADAWLARQQAKEARDGS